MPSAVSVLRGRQDVSEWRPSKPEGGSFRMRNARAFRRLPHRLRDVIVDRAVEGVGNQVGRLAQLGDGGAAASFISRLIWRAPARSAPRKIPG